MKTRSTTILSIRHNGQVVVAGDGQVSLGTTVIKHNAKKVRRLYQDRVITGFAGTTADAFTLFDKLEQKLEQYNGNLMRAAVELAKDWRTDKILQRLEAMIAVADTEHILVISGTGDVIEPDDGIVCVGAGGTYALAAARGLIHANPKLSAEKIAQKALEIASEICVYTNANINTVTVK